MHVIYFLCKVVYYLKISASKEKRVPFQLIWSTLSLITIVNSPKYSWRKPEHHNDVCSLSDLLTNVGHDN